MCLGLVCVRVSNLTAEFGAEIAVISSRLPFTLDYMSGILTYLAHTVRSSALQSSLTGTVGLDMPAI